MEITREHARSRADEGREAYVVWNYNEPHYFASELEAIDWDIRNVSRVADPALGNGIERVLANVPLTERQAKRMAQRARRGGFPGIVRFAPGNGVKP